VDPNLSVVGEAVEEHGHRWRRANVGAHEHQGRGQARRGWHLKVGEEATADRVLDVDDVAVNPNLLGGPGDGAGGRGSRSKMERQR
jgi:hypothetical protein